MKHQRGFTTIYVIAGLAVALSISCYGLYKQVQNNGVLKADKAQLEQAIKSAAVAYQALEAEKNKVEVITLDNIETKEVIVQEKEVVRYQIREVIKNAPPESCLLQPIDPVVLGCLRDPANCNGPGTQKDVPTGAAHVGYKITQLEWGNLWRVGRVRY
jgi:hypothetical protein